eukprot:6202162-Pleurochrysis_carterae.AAC.5
MESAWCGPFESALAGHAPASPTGAWPARRGGLAARARAARRARAGPPRTTSGQALPGAAAAPAARDGGGAFAAVIAWRSGARADSVQTRSCDMHGALPSDGAELLVHIASFGFHRTAKEAGAACA